MKKLFSIFVFTLAAAPLLASASTCETRVDKHQGATTSERVEYCLTEEPPTEETDVTEVVLSDVYSVQYPKQKTKQPAPQQEETKIYSKEPVSMEYLDRDDYPAFRNDIMPSLSNDDAHAAALEVLGMASEPKENTGKKSLKKPARTMKAQPQPDTTATIMDTASYPAQTSYPPADQTTYPAYQAVPSYQAAPAYQAAPNNTSQQTAVQTPQTQVQQAQAIQNDPQNPAYNTAGVPAGFDGNTQNQSNFGYNATDPAFQP